MSLDTRIAAFVEYVGRPLLEDFRKCLEELRTLDLGLTQQTVKEVIFALGLWHLMGEVLRGLTLIAITWIICQTLLQLWPFLL